MTELTNEPDFNLTEWLDAAKRPERAVVVFGRADLLADIDELESQLRALASIPAGDLPMGGSEASEIERKIDALYELMGKSKMVIRVRALIDDESEKIRNDTEVEIKDLMDKAAASARKDAVANCKRANPDMPANDINAFVRSAAITASTQTLQREADIRVLAAAIVSPRMDVDTVKQLIDAIGETQVNSIKAAYSRATNEAPKVVLPKSLRPSQIDDGAMSS